MNLSRLSFAVLLSSAVFSSLSFAENARFVRIFKDQTGDTRFHLAELEVFENGVTPNEAGTLDWTSTMATSTNDIGDGALTAFNVGAVGLGNIGTTSTLEHGGANQNPNNALEGGGSVWSTANGQGVEPQYTLDLGSTFDVTEVRAWARNDSCCDNRWEDLAIQLFEDDGMGSPGDLVAELTGLGGTNNVPFSAAFDPAPAAVPEPASLAMWSLLGLAGVCFGWRRVRRRK